MDCGPILAIKVTVTTDIILKTRGDFNGYDDVMCKQTLAITNWDIAAVGTKLGDVPNSLLMIRHSELFFCDCDTNVVESVIYNSFVTQNSDYLNLKNI